MPDISTKAESTLSAKTDVNKTDSVRLVGTDDHSYKSSVGDLAKCVLEECNVSSLAGATQTPKSAIDTLNSNKFGSLLPAADAKDCDNIKTIGVHYAASFTHSPSGVSSTGYLFVYPHSSNDKYIKQAYTPYATDVFYIRTCNNGTWTTWTKIADQTDIDALNSNFDGIKLYRKTANTNGVTFTLTSGFRGLMFTIDSAADRCGAYFIYSGSTGGVGKASIKEASALTIDISVNSKLTITSPGATRVIFIVSDGSIT